ncbi:MAG: 30S ribosomal protein S6 [Dehalococcoidia bacterium]
MREYELTVIYDLAVAEAGGPEAAVQQLNTIISARGGTVLKVDHWGRRRMAYPINRAIDGDYIISRVELEPTAVAALEAGLQIDERVYRHLVVRADELPPPPVPREPRRSPDAVMAPAAAEAPAAATPTAEPTVAAAAPEAPVAEVAVAAAAPEAPVAEAAPAAAPVAEAVAAAEAAAPAEPPATVVAGDAAPTASSD